MCESIRARSGRTGPAGLDATDVQVPTVWPRSIRRPRVPPLAAACRLLPVGKTRKATGMTGTGAHGCVTGQSVEMVAANQACSAGNVLDRHGQERFSGHAPVHGKGQRPSLPLDCSAASQLPAGAEVLTCVKQLYRQDDRQITSLGADRARSMPKATGLEGCAGSWRATTWTFASVSAMRAPAR